MPGQADVPRWRTGGIVGALATVGSDAEPGKGPHFERLLASLGWFDGLVARHGDVLRQARSSADFDAAIAGGKIALMPAVEGGDQIDGSLGNLRLAYRRGVRSMGIVYDHHNAIGDGAMAMPASAKIAAAPHGGLSPFGVELVAEMNRLGMLVDLSHAAESTALEAIAIAKAPVIFSHSGARALADTPRNLSDSALRAVAANGGIVMVPLVPYLTTTDHWRWWSAGEARYAELSAAGDEAAVARGMKAWDAANPQPAVTVAHVADQIDHVARVAGKAHVGIGTDFDGMGDFAVAGLEDVAALPNLFAELGRRGWSEADLARLSHGNFLRVLRQVEAAADPDSRLPWRVVRFPDGGELRYLPPRVRERDYPPAAIAANAEGTSLLRLTVSPQGEILSCETARSSGRTDLDERACEIYRLRARFEFSGVSANQVLRAPVVWRLEGEAPAKEPPRS